MTDKVKLRVRLWRAIFWDSIELLVGVSSALVGFAVWAHRDEFAPPTISALPTSLILWWAIATAVGGTINVQGILFGNLYTRRAGLMLLAGSCYTLATTVALTFDKSRTLGALTYGISGLLFIFRFVALGRIDQALTLVIGVEARAALKAADHDKR